MRGITLADRSGHTLRDVAQIEPAAGREGRFMGFQGLVFVGSDSMPTVTNSGVRWAGTVCDTKEKLENSTRHRGNGGRSSDVASQCY